MEFVTTFKYRVKDGSAARHLRRHAIAVNQVWNYCCGVQRETQRRWQGGARGKWPSHFDLVKLTTGCAAEFGLHSDTVNKICAQFVASRDLHRKCPAFRKSFGARRSLGFVPYIARAVKQEGSTLTYLKRKYHFWKSREIDGVFKAGAFVEDARGRWYVTFQCAVTAELPIGNGAVGIDLGLKSMATMSNGDTIDAARIYRRYEASLAVAQRAGNKRRVKAIHARIGNIRRHVLHVESTKIANANSLIVVGDVSPSKLAKTRMAKSVLDAGWTMFRNMLVYKASRRQARCIVVNERFSTQTCSCCGINPSSSPKGMGALGIRHWTCSGCGASHDRDVNAARNILRAGQERLPLAGEIPVL